MRKKSICCLLALLGQICYAESCPTPMEIKQNQFHQWRVLDLDNATPLPAWRIAEFKRDVVKMVLAEWMQDAPEGAAHCYYEGNDNTADYLGVFLAKENLVPKKTAGNWRLIRQRVMQCTPAELPCEFIMG